jgi:chaperonin GroEL
MEMESGYLSPYFITDPARDEVILEQPYILIFDGRLVATRWLIPILEQVVRAGRSLSVIGRAVEGEALATLVVNKIRGTLRCCAIANVGSTSRWPVTMADLATLTGGRVIAQDFSIVLNDLGRAARVVVSANRTVIIDGASLN